MRRQLVKDCCTRQSRPRHGGCELSPAHARLFGVLPQPYLAQVTMTRQLQQALYEYCVRARACAAIAVACGRCEEENEQLVCSSFDSDPKGSGGPKAGFRRSGQLAFD